jgi:hypothetical protein
MALEARTPRRGTPVLVLLAVAGLLRPEAWILAGLYWLWLLPALDRGRALRAAALVAAAPLLWAASDLAAFGDPLFGFSHTTNGTAGRPHGVHDLFTQAPRTLGQQARPALVVVAALGYVLILRTGGSQRRLVAWTAAALVAFAVPVAGGTVVNPRYLLPTLVLMSVAAAAALTGWIGRAGRERRVRAAVAVAGALVLLATLPGHIERERAVRADTAAFRAARERFHGVVTERIPCLPLTLPNDRPLSMVVFWTGVDPRRLRDGEAGAPRVGSYLWGTLRAMTGVAYLPTDVRRPPPPPAGARVVRHRDGWTLSQRCRG